MYGHPNPPCTDNSGRTRRLEIRVSTQELATWQAQAEALGLSLSEWVRRRLAADSVDEMFL